MEILLDAALDSAKMLPLLFFAYVLIEYLEHKAGDRLQKRLRCLGFLGPVGGSILGLIPQCGFSAAASNFYAGRILSLGTLIAIFLATSDEAIPVLLSHPGQISCIGPMLLIKAVAGIVFGILIDWLGHFFRKKETEAPFEELCSNCDCDHHSIWYSAFHHTLQIFLFIFLVNLVLGYAISFAGEEFFSNLLLGNSVFQPLLTALIGLIPNCAASVLITELFVSGSLKFGSCIAGLCAGAGTGLLVLIRTNRRFWENMGIVALLYGCAVLTGLLVNGIYG